MAAGIHTTPSSTTKELKIQNEKCKNHSIARPDFVEGGEGMVRVKEYPESSS